MGMGGLGGGQRDTYVAHALRVHAVCAWFVPAVLCFALLLHHTLSPSDLPLRRITPSSVVTSFNPTPPFSSSPFTPLPLCFIPTAKRDDANDPAALTGYWARLEQGRPVLVVAMHVRVEGGVDGFSGVVITCF